MPLQESSRACQLVKAKLVISIIIVIIFAIIITRLFTDQLARRFGSSLDPSLLARCFCVIWFVVILVVLMTLMTVCSPMITTPMMTLGAGVDLCCAWWPAVSRGVLVERSQVGT